MKLDFKGAAGAFITVSNSRKWLLSTAVDEGPDWGIAGTPRPHNRAFAFCRSGPVRLAAAHHPKNCHSGDDRLGTRVTYYGSRPLHDLDRRTCQFPRW